MKDPLDVEAINIIMEVMSQGVFGEDPGGEVDWIEALSAWCVDKHIESSEYSDENDHDLAQKLSTIWAIGKLLEKELDGRFQFRASREIAVPYTMPDGELAGCCIEPRNLNVLSEDPREIACAVAAAIVALAEPHHNVVMFRRLHEKRPLFLRGPSRHEHVSWFGLARA